MFRRTCHALKPGADRSGGRPTVLIILMGSMGDVIRGLALASQLKAACPQMRLTWLVEPSWRPLVAAHPGIDEVLVFDRPRGLAAAWELRGQLSRRAFDLTLDLQRHFKSGCFSWFSGARRRIGFHPRDAKEFNWIFNTEHIPRLGDRISKLEHYFQFTVHLGIPAPDAPDFGLGPLASRPLVPDLQDRLPQRYVAVVMGSSWPSKDWVYEGYADLVRRIGTRTDLGVVLVGDRSQQAAAARLSADVGLERLVNLAGATDLIALAGVLGRAAAAVGPDSGPGHLAAAVGTPYVALFGPTRPERVAPYGCEHLVVRAPSGCRDCYKKRCRQPQRLCMQTITAAMVFERLTDVLTAGRLTPG
jgi:ADP-heptose:LPS heptosyltransferase